MRSPSTAMTVEALLSETDWLRTLCRQLVRDEDRAEDLFQETVVASLAYGSQRRGGMRPWLAGVARNLVASTSRAERRRRRRESAAARAESVEPTAATVARVAMQQEVIQAVRDLPEGQRDAVLLRYFEDLPPREIAARLEVPVATVKTRLKRGLAALRERLDSEHGDRRTWVAALLPFVSPDASLAPDATGTAAAADAARSIVTARVAAGAAALALAATATWIAWPSSPEDSPQPTGDEIASSPPTSAGAADATHRPDVSRAVVGATDPSAPVIDGPFFEVEVVDGATGAPVPGAEIRYARVDAGARPPGVLAELEAAVERREMTYAEFLVAVTDGTRTDARGVARIAQPADRSAAFSFVAVVGTKDARADAAVAELDGERVRLELRPRPVVSVRVIDRDGAPVQGAPVDYLLAGNVYVRGSTPASGDPLRLALPFVDPQWLPMGSVQLAMPLAETVVAPAMPDGDGIVLQLPETGTLEIEVRDPSGRPLPSGVLHLERPLVDPQSLAIAESDPDAVHGEVVARVRVADGEARVDGVEVDTSWRVVVRPDGYDETWFGSADAPHIPERTTRARIDAPRDVVRVGLRVVDVAGRPVTGRLVDAVFTDDRGQQSSHRARCDAEGRVHVKVSPDQRHAELELRISDRDAPTAAPLGARLPLPTIAADAPIELRTATVRPLDLLAAGRVLDASGRPVANALVTLVPLDASAESGRPADAFTDANGRFAVHGFDVAPAYRVTAQRDDLAPTVRDRVVAGASDLELVFHSVRVVQGRVRCGGAERDLRVRLVPDAPGLPRLDPVAVDDGGAFRIPGVPAGRYTVEALVDATGRVVHREPLDVPPGDEPLALELPDLSDRVTLTTVSVRLPTGTWPTEVAVSVESAGAFRYTVLPLDANGRFSLVVPPEGATFSIDVDGYEPVRLERVTGARTVTLRAR